jgi:hypothetical protein
MQVWSVRALAHELLDVKDISTFLFGNLKQGRRTPASHPILSLNHGSEVIHGHGYTFKKLKCLFLFIILFHLIF